MGTSAKEAHSWRQVSLRFWVWTTGAANVCCNVEEASWKWNQHEDSRSVRWMGKKTISPSAFTKITKLSFTSLSLFRFQSIDLFSFFPTGKSLSQFSYFCPCCSMCLKCLLASFGQLLLTLQTLGWILTPKSCFLRSQFKIEHSFICYSHPLCLLVSIYIHTYVRIYGRMCLYIIYDYKCIYLVYVYLFNHSILLPWKVKIGIYCWILRN